MRRGRHGVLFCHQILPKKRRSFFLERFPITEVPQRERRGT